mmetsp:Transcript_2182/g.4637  ORF Transcript_2182/g.4637 Transcript_2182/m.4637 type:complete len:498 (+) Transcript_2182:85-1578(+)
MRIHVSLTFIVAVASIGLSVASTHISAASGPFNRQGVAHSRHASRRITPSYGRPHLPCFATVSSDVIEKAKTRVLSLASNIKEDSKTGVFIADPGVKSDLKRAVADLEAVCGSPTDRERRLMLGDWALLCTTNSGGGNGDKKKSSKSKGPKLPFKLPELPFQDKATKSISVTQRIRSTDDSEGQDKTINRVDNVIEFTPFADTLGDLLGDDTPFGALKDLTVNPLEVSKSKIALVHKAEVLSVSPVLRTKISLQSYVLTVAGNSQYLDPDGADLLGLNVPLGDFQSGNFDTTYVDEELRISRGKVGLVDVLRVFVRKGIDAEIGALVDSDLVAGASDESGDDDSEPSKLDEVRDAVEGVADAVRKVNEDVRDAIKSDMESVRDSVEDVTNAIKEASEDVRDVVEEDMKDVVEAVEGVADVVVGKENRELIEKEIEGEIKNVQEVAEDVSESLKEIQSGVEDAIGVSKDDEDEEGDEGVEEEDDPPKTDEEDYAGDGL